VGGRAVSTTRTRTALSQRISLVVLTHNRRERVLDTVARLLALPERCAICVVDNASTDGTVEAVHACFPEVKVLRHAVNLGAAGRNAGLQAVDTAYVAFCDDDTWWAPGALARAVALLDQHATAAVLSARVLVGPEERVDPTCRLMAESPLSEDCLPGPVLLGFLAGACVVRRELFLSVGGYHPRLFLGAEEALMALDLAVRRRYVVYAADLVVHHHPAHRSDSAARSRRLSRNALWIAWLRLPLRSALRETWRILRESKPGDRRAVLKDALLGSAWVLRARRVVPARVERMRQAIDRAQAARQRGSGGAVQEDQRINA
jgi:GT2 family glycosyltransferase